MPAYDHIVVGGGVAGMTSALLLAKDGARVALIESFPLLAPTIRGFRRKGVLFDTGVHYVGGLGDGHPLDTYFKHLGIADNITKTPYDRNGFDRFIDETSGKSYDIPCDFDVLTKKLIKWFPDEKQGIEKYVTAIRQVMDSSPYLNFTIDFDLESALHAETVTLKEFLDKLTDNKALKAVLGYQNILYGVPPEEALFATHALVAGSYHLSAHTIEGGGLALAKAYEEQLKQRGVDVLCKNPVEMIDINDSREVEGVTLTNGAKLSAPSCLWTAHPRGLIAATPETAFRPAFKKRLKTLADTNSALMLFGTSDKPISSLEGRNIISWPGSSFEANLNDDLSVTDSIIYLSSALDPKTGKTAITAIMPQRFSRYELWADSSLKDRPEAYKKYKEKVLDEFAAEIFRRIPELKNAITFVDGATPLTIRDYCATPSGSLYGLRHSVEQFNPAPVTKAKGLTLAGQSIVAPGILGAIVSAYLACGIILDHEPLHSDLRQYA